VTTLEDDYSTLKTNKQDTRERQRGEQEKQLRGVSVKLGDS